MPGTLPISSQPMPTSPFTPQQATGAVTTGYNQGLQSLQNGYNSALASAGNALTASQNTTSGENMQLGNTLAQQQSGISQNLANRGLGNTTIAATATQAPMQAYNTAMAQVANQGAIRTMGADQNIAGLQAQSGQAYAQNQQGKGNALGGIMNGYGMQGQQNAQNIWNSSQAQQNANNNATQMSLAQGAMGSNAMTNPQMTPQQQYQQMLMGQPQPAQVQYGGQGQTMSNTPYSGDPNIAYQAQLAQMAQQPQSDDDNED